MRLKVRNLIGKKNLLAMGLVLLSPAMSLAMSSTDLQEITSNGAQSIGATAATAITLGVLLAALGAIGGGIFVGWNHAQEAKNRQQGHSMGIEFMKGFATTSIPILTLMALLYWIVNDKMLGGTVTSIIQDTITNLWGL